MPETSSRESGQREPNRLVHESSPYLQQHVHNPVEWYPWGAEALQKAEQLDRPIFLSIGYSACHWCHVMEHESFEDETIAELMNRHFINIKVDREERPDLDQIYMNAVLALSGRGGWPMSVFLTPDGKPFYGGTYWPPESRMGMPGFKDVLQQVAQAWETQRDRVQQGAEELTQAVKRLGGPQGERGQPGESLLQNALSTLLRSADREHGGFGGAPKFPHPMDIRLLLRCGQRFDSEEALAVVERTLQKMADGGIYDHLGGGFHRYSTDAKWLVPHFEKMLYDNALLVPAYLEAFQVTGNEHYARVARGTLDWCLREMTDDAGGFYSTQDADSEGEEGKFFVWSAEDIEQVLGPDEARLFNHCYDVTPQGNWEGKNILNRVKTHQQAARLLEMSEDDLTQVLDRCRRKLFEVREQRVHPGRDEKVLTSWNGLMIAAMATAAQVLGEQRFADAARNAADFLLHNLQDDNGRLLHAWKDGRARFTAYLDDYACLIDGLIELYQTTFEPRYLEEAVQLAETMTTHFRDEPNGGFFYTPDDHETLITRNKDTQDTATPSGNSTAATALLKLSRLTTRGEFEQHAVETLEMLAGQLARHPAVGGQALMAVDFLVGPAREIVLADGDQPEQTASLLETVRNRFLPNKVIARRNAAWSDANLPAALQMLLTGKTAVNGQPTAYVCEKGICHEPVTGVAALQSALSS